MNIDSYYARHGRPLKFVRSGVVLKPSPSLGRLGILNPACARLRDGTLQLYPRMVAPGNVSRIGSFRARESADGKIELDFCGFALEPEAPYELRDEPGGYGCEDPRVTFLPSIDKYAMAYVALGPRAPEVAVAISDDGLRWERLGLLQFRDSDAPFADKDAAFFPEPVTSPAGVEALAIYHRPTLELSMRNARAAIAAIEALPPSQREGISIGYIPFDAVRADVHALCIVTETHRLEMPPASWGTIKVGAGAPPVRIAEGWLSIIHGVDELSRPEGSALLRYCAGAIIHDAVNLERVIFRSSQPLFVPEVGAELHGAVGHVVFPTGIDRRGEREFDIYYGMADFEIGRGRLTLD
jgi:beta-1,2-mannobiose phosphorylase / 1,2-beta-oligomannan phosphorylase